MMTTLKTQTQTQIILLFGVKNRKIFGLNVTRILNLVLTKPALVIPTLF